MSNKDHATRIVRACAYAATDMLRNDGEILPQLIVSGADGKLHRMMFGWADDRERAATVAVAKALCTAKQASVAVTLIEAWLARLPDGLRKQTAGMSPQEGLDHLNDLGLVPSMQPDREEVVLIAAEYRDDPRGLGRLTETYRIVRDATGKTGRLGENITPDGAHGAAGIPFVLLPEKPPSRTDVIRAQRLIARLPAKLFDQMALPN